MNLDEMLSREDIRVTVEVDGERREYTKNFIVMHMGENCGTTVGSVGPIELAKAVDMLMNSINTIREDMSPMDAMMMDAMMMTIMMNRMMEERVKSE